MFDTIRMKTHVTVRPDSFPKDKTKVTRIVDNETGEIRTTYQVADSQIHYFKYGDYSGKLVIEVSIPKFLFGHNVRTVDESDIKTFWEKLNNKLSEMYKLDIDQAAWIVERLDVCRNFNRGNEVGEYIVQMAKKHVPYCKPHLIGYSETVEFKTSKNRRVITCYDKHLECISNKEPPEVIEQAKGILRFEITPSKHELKKYSADRKAINLLTRDFYDYVMSKKRVRNLLQFPEGMKVPTLDFEWLKSQDNIKQIETIIGFTMLLDAHGEAGLRPLYNPQTFATRKKLAQTLNAPSAKRLADLT